VTSTLLLLTAGCASGFQGLRLLQKGCFYGGGGLSFGLPASGDITTLTVSRDNGAFQGNAASSVVLSATYDGSVAEADASVTISCNKANGQGSDGSLTLSARNGITFFDATTQSTAGVVSINPDVGSLASFAKTNNIVKLSQADFDTLTPDANTLYLIVG
jgi:hypothetical protein